MKIELLINYFVDDEHTEKCIELQKGYVLEVLTIGDLGVVAFDPDSKMEFYVYHGDYVNKSQLDSMREKLDTFLENLQPGKILRFYGSNRENYIEVMKLPDEELRFLARVYFNGKMSLWSINDQKFLIKNWAQFLLA